VIYTWEVLLGPIVLEKVVDATVAFVYFLCHHFISFELELHFHFIHFLLVFQLLEVLFEVPY